MFRQWLGSHKSLAATLASGTVIVALVAGAAIVSDGYTAQRMDLGDASVWVSNANDQYVGRANTEVLQLDTVVSVAGSQSEVVQNGATVIAFDRADARAEIIDPATATVRRTVALPPDRPQVYVAGENVAVYSQGSGELWVVPLDSFDSFDADAQPTLNLGAGAIVSIDEAGMLFSFSPDTSRVSSVDLATASAVEVTATSQLSRTPGSRLSLTSVGSHWAVLDAATARLEVDGTLVDLLAFVGTDGSAVLQAANSKGSGILVAYSGGLVTVPFDGTEPTVMATGRSGSVAQPLVHDGCEFTAWSDGSAMRRCAADPVGGISLPLGEVQPGARLAFAVNGSRVVLNDQNAGSSWAVQRTGQLIDNWSDLISEDQELTEVRANDDNSEIVIEKNQEPPVAIDDELGARRGRSSSLPVLQNDYDPNGDVLVIDSVGDIDPALGTLDLINQRQQLQLNLTETATGTVSFDYTVSDGRGGSATASVRVDIRQDGENSAPQQVRTTRAWVEEGGRESFEVLADWLDPDGDPFYLTSATVPEPDAVSFGPDGGIVVSAAGSSAGRIVVALVVSDGDRQGTGSASVTVTAIGTVPIVADPFVMIATAGEEIAVAPLEHVRGGAGPVSLNAVPPRDGARITPSYEAGTFRFLSDEVRSHYIDYVVTDGTSTVTGTVRIEVTVPPDVDSVPITVPKTVFVRSLNSATVDVASTDIDPAGGVLLLTGTSNVPADSGIETAVLGQASVRVTLTALLTKPEIFNYSVTNGLASAEGSITVIEVPTPREVQPPVARDDMATARVGDAIVIDVLANDEQPDGLELTLDQRLVEGLSGQSGLLFAAGSTLRYLAPNRPGNFTAVYQVIGSNGQTAQAEVRIEVREPNAETNNPPLPRTVIGRVYAGQTVRIEIPLAGIDPDGDSVQFLGQVSNPEKGAVSATGASFIQYTAGDYSAGTDTFDYTVIDALGARATGTIRVGITERPTDFQNPIAAKDEVVARPGAAVSVQVLINDSDPSGGSLTVTGATPNDTVTTAVVEETGTVVTVTPPAEVGLYSVLYSIANEFGGSSQAFITVKVSEDAPLAYPVVGDSALTLSDVLGRSSVDVDVLQNVFFADGETNDLALSVVGGYEESARLTATRKIRVTVGPRNQIIPFVVAHPLDAAIRTFGLIWVPGVNDAPPQLALDAPPLTVESEQPLSINLNDYVVSAGDDGVRLTDSSTVEATHANGSALVVNDQTLRFTSEVGYSGPASISFEVTDGTGVDDPSGLRATLALPITVTQRDNAPPVFTGAVIDFEPAEEKQVDLLRLTNYPHPDDLEQLVYSVVAPLPTGFSYEIRGSELTIRAARDADVDSNTAITIAVRDDLAQGQPGRIALNVVSSTRPLVVPATDSALLRRGDSTTIDVLENDESTNPFPAEPLAVVSVSGANGSSLPAGISVSSTAGNSEITVTVADDAAAVDATLQYLVSDATNDPRRFAYGTVQISVQDVPDTPGAPVRQADQLVNGEVKLRITPAAANNSPITGYTVVSSSHGNYRQDCGLSLICALSGLTIGSEYRFGVIATNAVGDSETGALSVAYAADFKPSAPTSVTAQPSSASVAPNGESITVTWPEVPNPQPGTPVTGYTVLVSGAGVNYTARDATSPFVTTAGGALRNDSNYTVTVYARNSAQVASESEWRRQATTVRTVGRPSAPVSGPTATLTGRSGEIRVAWGASDPNGAGAVTYSIGRVDSGASASSCDTGIGKVNTAEGSLDVTSPWVDTSAEDGRNYTYILYVDNGIYCTPVATSVVQSKRSPGQASGTVSTRYRASGQYDIVVNADLTASGPVSRFEYRLGSEAWRPVEPGAYLTSSGDASHYGNATSVTFRACRDATSDYCGPDSIGSTVTPLDLRAFVAMCVPGSVPIITAPRNPGAVSNQYALAYRLPVPPVLTVEPEPVEPDPPLEPDPPVEPEPPLEPGEPGEPEEPVTPEVPEEPEPTPTPPAPTVYEWSGFTYSSADTVPSGADGVRIRATVTASGDSQTDPDYSEATCAPAGP